jgi:hypothetical protein
MNDKGSKGCERLICDITGGVQPRSIGRRRSVVDVKAAMARVWKLSGLESLGLTMVLECAP